MADFLIQRYLHNRTNEIRNDSGVWEDCFVVQGVNANQAAEAAASALSGVSSAVPGVPDRVRTMRWDNADEYLAPAGPRVFGTATKTSPPIYGGTVGGTV